MPGPRSGSLTSAVTREHCCEFWTRSSRPPRLTLRQVAAPVLVAAGDGDHDHASAGDLAAVLPRGLFTRVPGNHWSALASPGLAAAMVAFLAGDPRVTT
jgi:hypothetical protein